MNTRILLVLSTLLCFSFSAFIPFPYKQNNNQWRADVIGFGDKTIGEAGSLITSIASIVAGEGIYGYGKLFNPSTLNEWLKNNGGYENDDQFIWDSLYSFGFEFLGFTTDTNDMITVLAQGKIVLLDVDANDHYVVATISGPEGFLVMDPVTPGKAIYLWKDIVKAGIYSWNPKRIETL